MSLVTQTSQRTLGPAGQQPATGQQNVLCAEQGAAEATLAELYWNWFDVRIADTVDLYDAIFRLRYLVYCVENPFEDPSQSPDGRESDAYDHHAIHSLLIYRPTGLPAGTVRLVLPMPDDLDRSFALQHVCSHPLLRDRARFPVESMAEVSRFCVSKGFRRRLSDGSLMGGELEGFVKVPHDERRVLPHLTLGLIESLVRMSVDNGITHWCAVMEPTLLRLLTRLGIHFEPIGPLVDYHGRRQPCYIPLEVLLPRVQRERPDVWDVITRGGEHWIGLQQRLSEQRLRADSRDRDVGVIRRAI
jgi:N-acyl amino acid synthase of PEP-CTERM/exosortase system